MEDENRPEETPTPPPIDYSQVPAPPQPFVAQPPSGQPDAIGQVIPYKNPKALAAYYCAVFSVVPCFTPVLGPLAIIFGALGLRDLRQQPQLPGKVHAYIGIILGGLTTLAALALVIFVLIAAKKS